VKGSYKDISGVITNTQYEDTGLKSGTYYYKVRAVAAISSGAKAKTTYGDYSDVSSVMVVPEQVQGLEANAEGFSGISLSWNETEEADGYVVSRSDSPDGTFKKIATVKGKTSYTDAKCNEGETYYYCVAAYRSSVKSVGMNSKTAKAVAGGGVVSVNELSATAVSDTNIKLTWNAVPGAKSYQIYRSVGSKKAIGTSPYKTVTKNSYTDVVKTSTADFDQQIYYTVYAVSAGGNKSVAATANCNRVMIPTITDYKVTGDGEVILTVTYPSSSKAIKWINVFQGSTEKKVRECSLKDYDFTETINMEATMPKKLKVYTEFDKPGTYYIALNSEVNTENMNANGSYGFVASEKSNIVRVVIP
jgi:hypothetical protein